MTIIDRHILARFFSNYVVLFALLFVFAAAIDVILSLDDFTDAARSIVGDDASGLAVVMRLVIITLEFELPRMSQFFAYLNGLTAVGAMGFTLAQMVRHRELVAVMASGVSLYRLAMPFIVAVFILSVVQLINQEAILPRLAPLLLRDHNRIGEEGLENFEIAFTPDARGNLLQSPDFDPGTQMMTLPTLLERDAMGRTMRRTSADKATWSEPEKAWMLSNGVEVVLSSEEEVAAGAEVFRIREVDRFTTDLTPHMLLVRRYTQFASMLSLGQISEMLATPRIADRETLLRYRYSRFSSILINLMVMWLTLPCFLLREPANLLRQSVQAAALAIPASVGSAIGMMVDMPGIPPAASVFLPVVVLGFMCLFPWTFFKT